MSIPRSDSMTDSLQLFTKSNTWSENFDSFDPDGLIEDFEKPLQKDSDTKLELPSVFDEPNPLFKSSFEQLDEMMKPQILNSIPDSTEFYEMRL